MSQLHEQTCQEAEELKNQADEHEKLWREKKQHEVTAWRERIHREQEHWQHDLQHKLETCHTQHQKEMKDILHHSYLPNCAKTTEDSSPSSKWAVNGKGSAGTLSHLHNRQTVVAGQKKSRDGLKQQRKKSVRFQESASIHIIEEDELGLERTPLTQTPPRTPTASDAGGNEGQMREMGGGEGAQGASVAESSAARKEGGEGEEAKEEGGEKEDGQENKEGTQDCTKFQLE